MALTAHIEGIALIGPGFDDWNEARAILRGDAQYAARPTNLPVPAALPPSERRRASRAIKVALGAGLAAIAASGRDPASLATVFSSSAGDGYNCHELCLQLSTDDRQISPTRFHNSVHNAPSGYWGIATGATQPADSLAAFDASFGAGLVEALGRLAAEPSQPVALIAYDAPYPEPLHATRPIPDGFAAALVLASLRDAQRGPTITIEMVDAEPSRLADPALESMRRAIPAARSLPLLALLASGKPGRTVLEYLDGLALAVTVE